MPGPILGRSLAPLHHKGHLHESGLALLSGIGQTNVSLTPSGAGLADFHATSVTPTCLGEQEKEENKEGKDRDHGCRETGGGRRSRPGRARSVAWRQHNRRPCTAVSPLLFALTNQQRQKECSERGVEGLLTWRQRVPGGVGSTRGAVARGPVLAWRPAERVQLLVARLVHGQPILVYKDCAEEEEKEGRGETPSETFGVAHKLARTAARCRTQSEPNGRLFFGEERELTARVDANQDAVGIAELVKALKGSIVSASFSRHTLPTNQSAKGNQEGEKEKAT